MTDEIQFDGTGLRVLLPGSLRASGKLRIAPQASTGNRVFRVDTETESYSLRIPGRYRYIPFESEQQNQRLASLAEIAAPIEYGDDHVLISHWVNGESLSADRIGLPVLAGQVGETLARLHQLPHPFCDPIGPVDALEWNLAQLRHPGGKFSRLSARARQRFSHVVDWQPVNCHGDPVLANIFLDPRGEIRFIDWEFSHRTAAEWDLAVIANEAAVVPSVFAHLLDAYNRHRCTTINLSQLEPYRGLIGLISALWCDVELGHNPGNQHLAATLERQLEIARVYL